MGWRQEWPLSHTSQTWPTYLCDVAEAGQILLTQRVCADVEDLAEVEPFGELELKGFAKPVPTLNLLALKEGAA